MKKLALVLILLIAGSAAVLISQTPIWTEFYLSKVGSYYTLNVYRTPIRAWMKADSLFNYFETIIVTDSTDPADTTWITPTKIVVDSGYFGWLMGTTHLGTGANYFDNEGRFIIKSPELGIKDGLGGGSFSVQPLYQMDVMLHYGAVYRSAFDVHCSTDYAGFRMFQRNALESLSCQMSVPAVFWRYHPGSWGVGYGNTELFPYPLTVCDTTGTKAIFAIIDTGWGAPIYTFDEWGNWTARFGPLTEVDSLDAFRIGCRGNMWLGALEVDATPDSVLTVQNGLLMMAAWPATPEVVDSAVGAERLGGYSASVYQRTDVPDTMTKKMTYLDSVIMATGKPFWWSAYVYVKDTLGVRLRSRSYMLDTLVVKVLTPFSGNIIATYGSLNSINDTIKAGTLQSVNNVKVGNVVSIGSTTYGGAGVVLAPGGVPYIYSSKSKGAIGFGRNDTNAVVIDSLSGRWKLTGSKILADTGTFNTCIRVGSGGKNVMKFDTTGSCSVIIYFGSKRFAFKADTTTP